jgi:hypothetical protein
MSKMVVSVVPRSIHRIGKHSGGTMRIEYRMKGSFQGSKEVVVVVVVT